MAEETYATQRAAALARIQIRDPEDWPILATALVLDCPIWTENQTSSVPASRPGRPIASNSSSTTRLTQPVLSRMPTSSAEDPREYQRWLCQLELAVRRARARAVESNGSETVGSGSKFLRMVALRVPRDVRRRRVIDACSFCGRREPDAGTSSRVRSALICEDCAAQVSSLFAPATS